jgi:hypothetical protein
LGFQGVPAERDRDPLPARSALQPVAQHGNQRDEHTPGRAQRDDQFPDRECGTRLRALRCRFWRGGHAIHEVKFIDGFSQLPRQPFNVIFVSFLLAAQEHVHSNHARGHRPLKETVLVKPENATK